jgi:hypothetical protein
LRGHWRPSAAPTAISRLSSRSPKISQAGARVGTTTIAADFRRWHEIWTGKYPTDAASDAAAEHRWALEARIIESWACCLPDVLAKVRMLREHEKGGKWANEDECWRASPPTLNIW